MSLCPHGIRIEHRRCDRCEEVAEAEMRKQFNQRTETPQLRPHRTKRKNQKMNNPSFTPHKRDTLVTEITVKIYAKHDVSHQKLDALSRADWLDAMRDRIKICAESNIPVGENSVRLEVVG